MSDKLGEALRDGEFAVTCEVIAGRGAHEDAQERALADAVALYETGRVHAISVTDNPGGNPALLADAFACELQARGITTMVHLTCKDRNRNQMLSQLYALERAGVRNVLVMTGDYEAQGWRGRAKPVFDLDSVQAQLLVSNLDEGLEVEGRAGMTRERAAHFLSGAVVNPYKYRAGEVMPQYVKLEKKIACGARFVVTQLGYDTRKLHELLVYLKQRGLDVPVIANVFLLTRGAAKLMRAGDIAGCHVSDELLEWLERQAAQADKGRGARIELAAQMVAIARGLGCAGVHMGGFGLDADTLLAVLDRADELAGSWRELPAHVAFGEEGGFYLYEAQLDDGGAVTGLCTETRVELEEDITGREGIFDGYRLSRAAHAVLFTPGRGLHGALSALMERRDAKHGVVRNHGIEHTGKALLYGCRDCGDCGLDACLYSCPMAACPKGQRNGPCGGSVDGYCEVFPHERFCIWYKAYHRAARYGELWRLTSFITVPNKWEHLETSPWSNYTHGRDNIAGRLSASLWFDDEPTRGAQDG